MTIKLKSGAYLEASQHLADTVMSEGATAEQLAEAVDGLAGAIHDEVTEQFRSANGDRAVLAQRGFRQLTDEEAKYYQRIADAAMTAKTHQDFVASTEGMNLPQTVIDEVMSQVKRNHPLLEAINARAVARITKIFFSTGAAQEAVWGELDSAIAHEIQGAFREVDAAQNKLSAFCQISRDELALGPVYLSALMTATLAEAISNGLERAVVTGTGLNQPIGLDRDIHQGVSFSTSTGYPRKGKVALTSFKRAAINAVLAQLMTDEAGNEKAINVASNGEVTMPAIGFVCNTTEFLTKVDPAIHMLGANGNDVRMDSTKALGFYTTPYVAANEAICFIPSEYYLLVAGDRGIEASDDFKFLEDKRVFKQVMYGAGTAKDNTSSVLLDITDLAPVSVTVDGKVTTVAGA